MSIYNIAKKFTVITLILGLGLPLSAHAVETKNIIKAIKKMEANIQDSVDKKIIPGCAVAVVYRNQIVFMNGYGVRTIGKPEKIDVDTVFQLGSVSKPIAATLALILEQKGFIDLDNPVRKYLPNFTLKGLNNPDSVKVKNILSHTTGVPRGGFNNRIESFEPYNKIVRALQTTPVIAPVGKRYDYHNAMYSLIGEITESTTQKTFSDALTSNLLRPLNMTRTSATLEGLIRSQNKATPHTRVKKGLRPATPYSSGYYAVAPAGGINSSIRDMAIFLNAQLGGYPELLPPKVLQRIHTPLIPMNSNKLGGHSKNASYGLGWRILDFADQKMVYHGGWVKGFTNFIAFMPNEKLGIVVLHNGDSKFSARTVIKFFETALGLPDVEDAPTKGSVKKYKKKTRKKSRS